MADVRRATCARGRANVRYRYHARGVVGHQAVELPGVREAQEKERRRQVSALDKADLIFHFSFVIPAGVSARDVLQWRVHRRGRVWWSPGCTQRM